MSFYFHAFLHTLACITPVFHCWVLNSFTSAVYWSHCAVTLSSLHLSFFFFVAIVALFFFSSRILYFIFAAFVYGYCCFCSYCCLMLWGLAYAVVCFLTSAPPLLDTVDMKSRFETCHCKEHFPYLTRFC